MPVWLIFTFVFCGGSMVQMLLFMVMLFNRALFPLIPRVFSISGLACTPFLFLSGLLRPDPIPCICALMLAYTYWTLFDRNRPRRKRLRKLLGEKARAARAKLIANMPVSRPVPAGA